MIFKSLRVLSWANVLMIFLIIDRNQSRANHQYPSVDDSDMYSYEGQAKKSVEYSENFPLANSPVNRKLLFWEFEYMNDNVDLNNIETMISNVRRMLEKFDEKYLEFEKYFSHIDQLNIGNNDKNRDSIASQNLLLHTHFMEQNIRFNLNWKINHFSTSDDEFFTGTIKYCEIKSIDNCFDDITEWRRKILLGLTKYYETIYYSALYVKEQKRLSVRPAFEPKIFTETININNILQIILQSFYKHINTLEKFFRIANNKLSQNFYSHKTSNKIEDNNDNLSFKYIDTGPQKSRKISSYVITDARFKVYNEILYIQIQEGQLKNGNIIPETVTWREIDYAWEESNNIIEYNSQKLMDVKFDVHANSVITMLSFNILNGNIYIGIETTRINDKHLLDLTSSTTVHRYDYVTSRMLPELLNIEEHNLECNYKNNIGEWRYHRAWQLEDINPLSSRYIERTFDTFIKKLSKIPMPITEIHLKRKDHLDEFIFNGHSFIDTQK